MACAETSGTRICSALGNIHDEKMFSTFNELTNHDSSFTDTTQERLLSTPLAKLSCSMQSTIFTYNSPNSKCNISSDSYISPYSPKNHAWDAIEASYNSITDESIWSFELNESREFDAKPSDLSLDYIPETSDKMHISVMEFLHQCQEFADWLSHLVAIASRPFGSLAEYLIAQAELEELLSTSARRLHLAECARSLAERVPIYSEEIHNRLANINEKWIAAESLVAETMECRSVRLSGDNLHVGLVLADLTTDFTQLQTWLAELIQEMPDHTLWQQIVTKSTPRDFVEQEDVTRLQSTLEELQIRSRIIAAIFKVLEHLSSKVELKNEELEKHHEIQTLTERLQERFHEVWIQLLELQFFLEQEIIKEVDTETCRNETEGAPQLNDLIERENVSLTTSTDILPFNEEEYERICSCENHSELEDGAVHFVIGRERTQSLNCVDDQLSQQLNTTSITSNSKQHQSKYYKMTCIDVEQDVSEDVSITRPAVLDVSQVNIEAIGFSNDSLCVDDMCSSMDGSSGPPVEQFYLSAEDNGLDEPFFLFDEAVDDESTYPQLLEVSLGAQMRQSHACCSWRRAEDASLQDRARRISLKLAREADQLVLLQRRSATTRDLGISSDSSLASAQQVCVSSALSVDDGDEDSLDAAWDHYESSLYSLKDSDDDNEHSSWHPEATPLIHLLAQPSVFSSVERLSLFLKDLCMIRQEYAASTAPDDRLLARATKRICSLTIIQANWLRLYNLIFELQNPPAADSARLHPRAQEIAEQIDFTMSSLTFHKLCALLSHYVDAEVLVELKSRFDRLYNAIVVGGVPDARVLLDKSTMTYRRCCRHRVEPISAYFSWLPNSSPYQVALFAVLVILLMWCFNSFINPCFGFTHFHHSSGTPI